VRCVVYDDQAAAALDSARALFRRIDDAIEALEWLLARDDGAGMPVAGGALRMLTFRGAKSAGLPDIDCFFEFQSDTVLIHDFEIY